MSGADLGGIAPEILLTLAGVVLLLLEAFLPALRRAFTALALAAVAGAGYLVAGLAGGESFGGLLVADATTAAFSTVVLVAAAVALLASQGYLRRENLLGGEYHALFLWCAAGLLLMLRAAELLTLFLALETLSLCLYALAAYHRRLAVSTEAAVKYFLMGAFVSAWVLLGVALVYGETGATRLDEIALKLQAGIGSPLLLGLGVLLLFAGFAFKMSLAPFHAWSPDTYQGAPSPFVGFLSVAPKAASALVIMRLLEVALRHGALAVKWGEVVAALAVLSMVVGTVLALAQDDIKRMLAYSGIANMGYVLIPMVSLNRQSYGAVLVYLLAYALMNAGAFAVVAMLYPRPGEKHSIRDLAGWGYRFPLLGGCLAVCMLSLGGIPPTLGFLGKYLIFLHALGGGHYALALVGVASSLVAVFYYLRVIYMLYMKEEEVEPRGLLLDAWGRAAAVAAAGGTLLLGVWPAALLRWLGDLL